MADITTKFPKATIGLQSTGQAYGKHDAPVTTTNTTTHQVFEFKEKRDTTTKRRIIAGCAIGVPKAMAIYKTPSAYPRTTTYMEGQGC